MIVCLIYNDCDQTSEQSSQPTFGEILATFGEILAGLKLCRAKAGLQRANTRPCVTKNLAIAEHQKRSRGFSGLGIETLTACLFMYLISVSLSRHISLRWDSESRIRCAVTMKLCLSSSNLLSPALDCDISQSSISLSLPLSASLWFIWAARFLRGRSGEAHQREQVRCVCFVYSNEISHVRAIALVALPSRAGADCHRW